MKGLGMYSGTIYPNNESRLNAKECCLVITDEEATNEVWIANKRAENIQECIYCMGCPRSQGRMD